MGEANALGEDKMMLRIIISAALWVTLALPVCAQPVTLKFAFFTSDTEVTWVRVLKPFIDAVNADPSGAVKIEAFPNGALGRNLPQQPQMVLDGVADIAFVVPSLSAGRFPDDTLFEVPGLVKNLSEGTRLFGDLISTNSLRGYSEYVVLGSFMNANSDIYARRPIKALSSLKGMKVRILGPIVGQTVKEFGMIPVMMPPNEVVEALGRGTIDALTTSPSAFVDFGLERVANSTYFLRLGANSLAVVMNRAKFESMPKTAQDVLLKHAGKALGELYIKEINANWLELMNRFKTDPNRTVVFPSEADQKTADLIFAKVAREWAARDPRNEQLLTTAREFLASIRSKYPSQ